MRDRLNLILLSSINSWSWAVLVIDSKDSKILLRGFDSCCRYIWIYILKNKCTINCFWAYLYPFRNKNCYLNQIPPHFLEFLGRHMTFPRFIGYLIGFFFFYEIYWEYNWQKVQLLPTSSEINQNLSTSHSSFPLRFYFSVQQLYFVEVNRVQWSDEQCHVKNRTHP